MNTSSGVPDQALKQSGILQQQVWALGRLLSQCSTKAPSLCSRTQGQSLCTVCLPVFCNVHVHGHLYLSALRLSRSLQGAGTIHVHTMPGCTWYSLPVLSSFSTTAHRAELSYSPQSFCAPICWFYHCAGKPELKLCLFPDHCQRTSSAQQL